mmetsp:Transcript_53440/g.127438  ORF Transcript_53440/g.127438 Transcript_53440/m.127438 type:complete len:206 (-) Transcript_53440:861-1478(-)
MALAVQQRGCQRQPPHPRHRPECLRRRRSQQCIVLRHGHLGSVRLPPPLLASTSAQLFQPQALGWAAKLASPCVEALEAPSPLAKQLLLLRPCREAVEPWQPSAAQEHMVQHLAMEGEVQPFLELCSRECDWRQISPRERRFPLRAAEGYAGCSCQMVTRSASPVCATGVSDAGHAGPARLGSDRTPHAPVLFWHVPPPQAAAAA